jgi:hypothetical protein
MGQYMPVYRTGASFFVPEFHTGIYKYILYPFTIIITITGSTALRGPWSSSEASAN